MPAPILDNFYFQSTKKFRNALAFVLLFSAFIPGALWVFKDKLIQLPLSVRKANNFEQLAFLLFLNLFLLVLPFVSITCFEIIHSKKKLVGTSVFRVLRSDGYRLADVWYYFLHSLTGVLPLTVAFISLGSSEFNNQLSTWMNAGFSSTFDAGLILNNQVLFLALAVLFIDLSHYIKHRCQHSISLIWDLHEFHHSASEMTIFNNFRESPHQGIFTNTITLPLTAFSAFALDKTLPNVSIYAILFTYGVYMLVFSFNTFLGHSSTKVIYPKPISWIFMSPSLHWIHHSNDPAHYDKNFGLVFTFWDRLFGSYLSEAHIVDITAFGVTNSQYNKFHPIYSWLALPYIKIMRRLKKSILNKSLTHLISH